MNELKDRLWISIAAFGVMLITVFLFDRQVGTFIQGLVPDDAFFLAKVLSRRGLYFFYAVFGLMLVFSLLKKNRKTLLFLWAYIKSEIIIAFAFVRLLKILLGRARPGIGSGFAFFSLDSKYNSFPSGHSADAFVCGIFLFYLLSNSTYSRYRFLPLILASLVALSRIVVNAHHPSDVVGGVAIGVLGALFFLSPLSNKRV